MSSARNARLLEICKYVRTSDDNRIVESLASGIPAILKAVNDAGMPSPLFIDSGVDFTAKIYARDLSSPPKQIKQTVIASRPFNSNTLAVFKALSTSVLTVIELEHATKIKAPTIRKCLRTLIEIDLVKRHGGKGQRTTYEVSTEPDRQSAN